MYTAIFPLQCGADHIGLYGVSDVRADFLRRLRKKPLRHCENPPVPTPTGLRFALLGRQRMTVAFGKKGFYAFYKLDN